MSPKSESCVLTVPLADLVGFTGKERPTGGLTPPDPTSLYSQAAFRLKTNQGFQSSVDRECDDFHTQLITVEGAAVIRAYLLSLSAPHHREVIGFGWKTTWCEINRN